MKPGISCGVAILFCSTLLAASPPSTSDRPADLDFDARVRAQAAIERVYHRHRIDAPAEFDEAVPQAVVEAKVSRFLRQSRALEQHWKTPVTSQMLDRELQRMVRDSRDPERLQELFAALDNDPVRIRECLARPILVDRLVRNFSSPNSLPDDQELATWLLGFQASPVKTVSAGDARLPEMHGFEDCGDDHWKPYMLQPAPRRKHHSVWTGSEMIIWGGLLGNKSGSRYDPATDTWTAMALPETAPNSSRDISTTVWSGTEMLVWGGSQYTSNSVPGTRYNPVSDTWTPMSTIGALASRWGHAAVWTGDEMIVWGGYFYDGQNSTFFDDGRRYDPITDTWAPISTTGAPEARYRETAVWSGSEMIVWGGSGENDELGTGGRYDPTTDTWAPVSDTGAPTAREFHTAVWTGSEMIVWGGASGGSVDTGGRYDPATDTWTPTSLTGAPDRRFGHAAVWTGSLMIVWGADTYPGFDTGGRYDPVTDSWTPTSLTGAPETRQEFTAVWTGDRMIVWGGRFSSAGNVIYFDSGGRYDPVTDTWTPTYRDDLWTSQSQGDVAVWTGSEMIVWGGGTGYSGAGTVYDPATGVVRPTGLAGAPVRRDDHSAVWTGTEMIVWGGFHHSDVFDNGGRYDPVSDQWTTVSLIDAPAARTKHTAVWTGAEMIVWGGAPDDYGDGGYNDGARYDPWTDSWMVISTDGAPDPRNDHLAVWTGREMLVCAGTVTGSYAGGRYDPAADRWEPMSAFGSPDEWEHSAAVWTGTEMLVWGGRNVGSTVHSGMRYHPGTDTWTLMSTAGAPSGRYQHTAIWTSSRMVVWGGRSSYSTDAYRSDGGSYDPATDSWTLLDSANAPWPRTLHLAVWTGEEMIVWSGYNPSIGFLDAGFYEIPDGDSDGVCGDDDCEENNPNCVSDCTDADADGYCVTHDCDESNPNCTSDCTDGDADGYCIPEDCDDSEASCTEICLDLDDDGKMQCAGDCDDYNANCTDDCTDADGDGFCVPYDCDDLNANCITDCTDIDGDGYCATHDCYDFLPGCTTDCQDLDHDGYCEDHDCDIYNPNCNTDCTDADNDLLCVTTDCDDYNANCTDDCTDADADGYCVTTDCDDSLPGCNIDCNDWDNDGHICSLDCAPFNPKCTTDCTDADSDDLCVTHDCDDLNPNCGLDCTDGDGDGYCYPHDCDDASAGCTGTDCSDADGDGLRVCEDDCDDLNPNCGLDCADPDGDTYCSPADCDENNPRCTTDCTDADADGYCVTADCDDALPECNDDCGDHDADGLPGCEGDCDDHNPNVLPGLDEVCTDNADNDCNGLTDHEEPLCADLEADQIEFASHDSLSWTGAAGADTYGLYRGKIPSTGMVGYDHLCEATALTESTAIDPDLPELGRGYYYLVAGQSLDHPGDRFTGGPLGLASGGASRPTSDTITCGPRLYVDPDVVLEGGDGLSWNTAYSAVSLALDHPAFRDRGSEVWVRGSVTETGVQLPEIARPGMRLLGGFDGSEIAVWQRSPETTPTIWSGNGGLLLFQAVGTSVVLDGLTMRDAISGFVGAPAGPLTEITNVTMEQMSERGVDLLVENPGQSKLIVYDSIFDTGTLTGIRVVSHAGLLTGEIRGSTFSDWGEAALKLEARPQTSAEIRLDIVSNIISGGGAGIVLGTHVDDLAGPAIQSSFIGSNLIHGTAGNALTVEATGLFDFEDGPALVDARPLIVGNTLVDNDGDGLACVASRSDLTVAPELHVVRATPQVWNNLITHNLGAGISETPDDPGTNWSADPVVVGNGLHGNSPLYRDEGTTDLTLIDDVNALGGAYDNFDDDPRYVDRSAQDYHLAYGTVVGFESPMRYLANETDPGLGMLWTQPGFDASTWSNGIYGVGFDTGPTPNAKALLHTKVSPATVSVYTLATFTVDDVGSILDLILGVDYDDGMVVWINGVEVFRSTTVPPTTLEWNTTVGEHESSNGQILTYETFDISAAGVPVLLEGENLLAVAVWNAVPSDDLVLVPRLILQQESPAVDAGHLDAPRITIEDVDGDARVNDSDRDGASRPDVGADERW